MNLSKPIARTLDDSARILGLSPFEIASCAAAYAVSSVALRGVPFSALLALGGATAAAVTLRVVNLTKPPEHAIHWIMHLVRPDVLPVMAVEKDFHEK